MEIQAQIAMLMHLIDGVILAVVQPMREQIIKGYL